MNLLPVSRHPRLTATDAEAGFQQQPCKAQPGEKTFKLVMFEISALHFALRIEAVQRVVGRAQVIYGSQESRIGIAHIGDEEITVVDLHKRFTADSNLSTRAIAPLPPPYLIITHGSTGEWLGIPVTTTPVLCEVTLSQIRALPNAYCHANQLRIANHVALIPQEPEPITVFLIDVERIFQYI
ncbi:MAG: chemotaxis protein CheW [Synechococcales bacterium]|nr:chemotaxis protein CheW [Synechococcales bacterium]